MPDVRLPRTSLLPEPDPLNDADRKLLAIVQEFGFQVTHVLPQPDAPGWSYSIGMFRSYGQPEVVTFGLDQSIAQAVVNELGRRARAEGIEAEQVHEGLLEGHRCVLKPVDPCWYDAFLGWGLWYYQHQSFPVLQLVWSDHSHRYPWDPAFYEQWRWAQPILFETDPGAANVHALLRSMREH